MMQMTRRCRKWKKQGKLTSPLLMLRKRSKTKNPLPLQPVQGYIFNPFFSNPKER
ncbi:hypothetical protein Gohar_011888, partial [Gossypium harknessii]|nr:hypothetical protein [Gossypium davidsonii]MBA0801528.1 hypothetical protein [Gossypium harknessii]